MSGRLSGKVCVVTGTGGSMGRATAVTFSDRGSRPARRTALGRSRAAPAVQRAYGFDHLPTEDEMVQVAERWRPYRSLAVSYLFASQFEKGT
jgi:3-methyladenine DNA glycosylase/8-oxoguanine DNA glycosylase